MALLDDFNRADEDLGAPNWTAVGFPPSIVSNQLEFAGFVLLGAAWNDTFAADQEASVDLVTRMDDGFEIQLLLRGSDDFSGDDGVQFRVEFGPTGAGDDIVQIKDQFSGAVLASSTTESIANGDVLLARVVGTTASFYQNGNLILTVTDAGVLAGAGNLYLFGNGSPGIVVDNFSGGEVAAAAGGAPPTVRMSLPVLGLPPLS